MTLCLSNDKLCVISHKSFIDHIYKNVVNECNEILSYEISNQLFEINKSFVLTLNEDEKDSDHEIINNKNYKKKKRKLLKNKHLKNCEFNNDETDLQNTINYVKSCYENLQLLLGANDHLLKLPLAPSNDAALNFVKDFHKGQIPLATSKGGNTSNTSQIVNINNNSYLIPPNCLFYNNDIRKINDFFTFNDVYDLIIIDPPWINKYITRLKNNKLSSSYSMLNNDDIANIPINKFIKNNTIIAIWCTNSPTHINAIKDIFLPKWNLKIITTWYWIKVTKEYKIVCPFRDQLKKQPYEQIFLACHTDANADFIDNIIKKRCIFSIPSAIHSHKPPLFDLLKEYLPTKDTKCLEIFARYLLPNFTSIGLEVLKLQDVKLFVRSYEEI